jgi:hypothetical protein
MGESSLFHKEFYSGQWSVAGGQKLRGARGQGRVGGRFLAFWEVEMAVGASADTKALACIAGMTTLPF